MLTYAQFEERSNRLANALRELGIGHLDRCTTVGYNSAAQMIIGSAIRKLVMVGLPMNYRLQPDERQYELPTGQAGELWIKSPQEITEYWRNDEATTGGCEASASLRAQFPCRPCRRSGLIATSAASPAPRAGTRPVP